MPLVALMLRIMTSSVVVNWEATAGPVRWSHQSCDTFESITSSEDLTTCASRVFVPCLACTGNLDLG